MLSIILVLGCDVNYFKSAVKEKLHEPSAVNLVVDSENITSICAGVLQKYRNLKSIRLTFDETEEIQTGSFDALPRLRIVDLSNNRLKSIRAGVFNDLQINLLELSYNRIESIETAAFDRMPKLVSFYIISNRIETIDAGWFRDCSKLAHLDFSSNAIRSLPANILPHLNDDTNTKITLNLYRNEIQTIHPNAFSKLRRLRKLRLDQNELEELDENVFKDVDHLENLNLSRNNLTCLPCDKRNLLKAQTIVLGQNPWNCVCFREIQKFSYDNTNLKIDIETVDC